MKETTSGRLAGKIALITGAGRGIGQAVALGYAEVGASLVICSRTASELESTANQVVLKGAKVIPVVTDVSQPVQVERMVNRAIGEFGRIDVLVNNAGVGHSHISLVELPVEEWDRVLAVNLRGPFLCARAVLPHMIRQQSGHIINVSSWLGRSAMTGYGAYGISKWGLEGLTRYLAEEHRGDGIRVNSVGPGCVATKMTGYGGAPPETVVELFVHLASDAAVDVTGRAIDIETWRRELGVER
jgi:NAD(P)-dependent dehydrogenase (short-subunit alcohol dehydrogenase family)